MNHDTCKKIIKKLLKLKKFVHVMVGQFLQLQKQRNRNFLF